MRESTLKSARLIAAMIAVSPVVFTAVVAAIGGTPPSGALVFPAMFAGLESFLETGGGGP